MFCVQIKDVGCTLLWDYLAIVERTKDMDRQTATNVSMVLEDIVIICAVLMFAVGGAGAIIWGLLKLIEWAS